MEEATWSQTFLKRDYIVNSSLLVTPPPQQNKTISSHPENSGALWWGERKRNLKRGVGECEKQLLSSKWKKGLKKAGSKEEKGDGGEGLLNYKDTLLKKAQALGEGS